MIIRTYCERCGPGLFDEPINASSNIVFFFAAYAACRLARRMGELTAGVRLLIGLALGVGIGSTLWHTFATTLAMALDAVPILLFHLVFLCLYGREVARLQPTVIGLLLLVYGGSALCLVGYRNWLNGLVLYAPTLAMSWMVGMHYYRSVRRERGLLLLSAAVLGIALSCRAIDLVVCRQLPIGTHFLWHILNGVSVYLGMRALIIA